MTSGIYKIINVLNNKFYLGSSLNIEKRFKRHFNDLRLKNHHSIYLQRSFDKYGETNFTTEIVEEINSGKKDLIKKEQEYLDYYLINNYKTYNVSKNASGGDLISYHPNRSEIIKKNSNSTKQRYVDNPDLLIKASLNMMGEKNPMFGKTHSDEARQKISKASTGRIGSRLGSITSKEIKKIQSEFWKGKRIGEENPFYGKKHNDKTKEILSKKYIENIKILNLLRKN